MDAYREVVSLENEALDAYAKRRYRDAALSHGKALALAEKMNRPRLMAVLFNRLGQALEGDGDVQNAVIAYESGLRALAADANLDVQRVLMSLGAVSKGFGGPGALAVPDLFSAAMANDLDVAESDPALAVRLLINVGNGYLRQPQPEPALNAYRLALQRPEAAQSPELRAHALTHVGFIHRQRGEIEAAEAALNEGLALLAAHGEPLDKRRALAVLAGIYRDRGQTDKALDTYWQALALYAQANDPLGEGRTQAGLGRLYLEQERFGEARKAYERAVALATQVDDDDTLWHAYWGLGRCQRAAGDLDGAAASFRRSLDLIATRQRGLRTDEGKVAFLESVQDAFDQLLAVHLERGRTDAKAYADALAVAEEARGRALSDLMGGQERRRPAQGGSVRPSRLRPFAERQSLLPWAQMAPGMLSSLPDFDVTAKLASGTPSPPQGFSMAAQMAPGIASGSLEPAENLPDETPEPPAPTPPPLARLVFHVLADATAVFAVVPDGSVQAHLAALGRDALAGRIAALRQALQVDDNPRGVRLARDTRRVRKPKIAVVYKPLLRELYDTLVAPVAAALPTDGTPVVIEPHGALWLLPFAALLAPDDTWLADRWPLLYSPSARVLDEIRREPDYGTPNDLKALVVGNPAMPKVPPQDGLTIQLKPLPGARKEAEAVAGLFPEERRTLLLGRKADRATVENLFSEHGILHLATHGIAYADDPLSSFVALAEPDDGDGLLTARRITYLSLPSEPVFQYANAPAMPFAAGPKSWSPAADLVVLSACQTGLGKISGDGMIGLCRAFLVAGARAVLVSQWSVSDEATAELMTAFYRDYIALDDKAIALQRAMRVLRSRPGYDHPRYWAPFVVVGAEA
ncbi:MAG: CHAT domain-containing protein [Anaerolineae bacterium]|nr:CHAT domain-containing protein [Anaerolineae bacterium]